MILIKNLHREPVACRWDGHMEVDYEGDTYAAEFLFDVEGVETHTVVYYVNGEELDEKEVPTAVSDYIESLSYRDMFDRN